MRKRTIFAICLAFAAGTETVAAMAQSGEWGFAFSAVQGDLAQDVRVSCVGGTLGGVGTTIRIKRDLPEDFSLPAPLYGSPPSGGKPQVEFIITVDRSDRALVKVGISYPPTSRLGNAFSTDEKLNPVVTDPKRAQLFAKAKEACRGASIEGILPALNSGLELHLADYLSRDRNPRAVATLSDPRKITPFIVPHVAKKWCRDAFQPCQ